LTLKIESCIVCDFIRPELNGKLIILGFFGVCPEVDVAIQRLDQPATLTFLFSGSPGAGMDSVRFDVVDDAQQRTIASTTAMPFQSNPAERPVLAPTLLLVFGHPGIFSVRCIVDEAECFRGQFRVTQGIAD